MLQNLHIALIQFDMAWENVETNFDKVTELLSKVPSQTNLVVLPEMFTTGFTQNKSIVNEVVSERTIERMKTWSHQFDLAICGSAIIKAGNDHYNRFLFITPQGTVFKYDKRHLFSISGEDGVFASGKKREIIEYLGWQIRPSICYDLRFPVWLRNNIGYHLMINCANWPAARNSVWETLLKARAIENQCYVVGCNRVGTDALGVKYLGNSMVINFLGEPMAEISNDERIISFTLNAQRLVDFRQKFPVWRDADTFEIL